MEDQKPLETESKRNPDGTFKVGNPGGPGHPKGKTMKEFAREFLMSKTDEEKREWLAKQSDDLVWRMAEGNPAQDLTSGGEKIFPDPILGFLSKDGGNKNGDGVLLKDDNET